MSVPTRTVRALQLSLRWIGLAAVSIGGWALFEALGLTAPSLFAALVVAVVFALTGLGPAAVPRLASMAAQGTLAVTIGLMLDTDTLGALGENWIPAVLVGAGTLVVSAGCGALLALHRDVDPVTGALSLIAGGATGLVSVARELGGDERIVAVVQYLRVAAVVVTMPLIVTFAFDTDLTDRGHDRGAQSYRPRFCDGVVHVATSLLNWGPGPLPCHVFSPFLA